VAEPYAGAAGASLELLLGEYAESVLINDLDYRIYAFWWAVLKRTDQFIDRIRSISLTIKEWRRQRTIYRTARKHKRFDVGFATFYLNRTNRSGIIVNGGPIGGIEQEGEWGLDARFTRSTLVSRIERIAAYRDRILISNLDALEFVERIESSYPDKALFIYLDPPYYEKGQHLFSTYVHEDHVAVSKALRSIKRPYWAITYDDVPAIRKIFANCRVMPFRLRYTAHNRRHGKELLILPSSLVVPPRLLSDLT
jgi:DNA adenine methylase